MLKRFALMSALALSPIGASAETVQESIISQLAAQGFNRIEVHRTLLGRVRLVAYSDTKEREVIFNPATGAILRDRWENIDDEGSNVLRPPSGGNSGSGNSGSDDDDDDEDDDDDQNDEDDDQNDEDDDDDDDEDDKDDSDEDDDDDDEDDDDDDDDDDEDDDDEDEDDYEDNLGSTLIIDFGSAPLASKLGGGVDFTAIDEDDDARFHDGHGTPILAEHQDVF